MVLENAIMQMNPKIYCYMSFIAQYQYITIAIYLNLSNIHSMSRREITSLLYLCIYLSMNFCFGAGLRERKPKSLHGRVCRKQRLKLQYENLRCVYWKFLIWCVSRASPTQKFISKILIRLSVCALFLVKKVLF